MPIDLVAIGVTYGLPYVGGMGTLWATQWLKERSGNKKADREVKHLALELADALEKFSYTVTSTASDVADHVADGHETYMLGLPNLPELPKGHERWCDLDLKITNSILNFQDTHRSYDRRINGAFQYAHEDEVQEEVRICATLLAAQAFRLAGAVRKRYGHPKYHTEGHWPVFLGEQYRKLHGERKKTLKNAFPLKDPWWAKFKRDD